jgi:hypothetical protein
VRYCTILLTAFLLGPAVADETVTVAVASNFSRTAAELSAKFAGETGIAIRISNGSTGKLYAQILNGAPFDIFLAADAERPALLEESGLAVSGSRFTYAEGALVLWSRGAPDCLAALRDDTGGHVALANPVTAPYGKAALEFLIHEGYREMVSDRIVYGENIAQTLQFVATSKPCCWPVRPTMKLRSVFLSFCVLSKLAKPLAAMGTGLRRERFRTALVIDPTGACDDACARPAGHARRLVVIADDHALETRDPGSGRDADSAASNGAGFLSVNSAWPQRWDRKLVGPDDG